MRAAIVGGRVAAAESMIGKATLSDTTFSPVRYRPPGKLIVPVLSSRFCFLVFRANSS
jgi:hypothetical protein